MAGGASDQEDEITGINVTPLVDIMLVLLIIFMVTASYIVNKSINIQLPKAATGEAIPETKNLAFVLDKDAQLFLDGRPITFEELPSKVAEAKAAAGDTATVQALIAADTATPHGVVVKLIDLVRKSGITDFAINIEASVP
jgi:biopolymer transport protein ExbD